MRIHLISMPFTHTHYVSIQVGALKAYLDKNLQDNTAKTFAYSAHLSILMDAFHYDYRGKYLQYQNYGEILGFILLIKNFNPLNSMHVRMDVQVLEKILAKKTKIKGTSSIINKLEAAAKEFVRRDLVPNFSKKETNIVGLTLTHNQIYFSLFCYFYIIKNFPKYKCLFVFGGSLAGESSTVRVLKRLGVEGLLVVGEGEMKLQLIAQELLRDEKSCVSRLGLFTKIPGVYSIRELKNSYEAILPEKTGQIKCMNDIPVPDYDDYFNIIKCRADNDAYITLKDDVVISIEGSRGCSYSKCDFCAVDYLWCNYRMRHPDQIFSMFVDLIDKYQPSRVHFVDSTCGVWIERFCDRLIENDISLPFYLDLRADLPERVFVKLYICGCRGVELGIESFSDRLLAKMNKGTSVIQNIQCMKYLNELGIEDRSNIIFKHPKSIVEDVSITKKLFTEICFLSKIKYTEFMYAEGSPLYSKLSTKEKKMARLDDPIGIPKCYKDIFISKKLPRKDALDKKTESAWASFSKWYDSLDTENCRLEVRRMFGGKIVVRDSRNSSNKEYVLGGLEAKIYDSCHSNKSVDDLVLELGVSSSAIKGCLSHMVRNRIVLKMKERYLSLALRPRQELLLEYFKRKKQVLL